jgi:hypothetical protein
MIRVEWFPRIVFSMRSSKVLGPGRLRTGWNCSRLDNLPVHSQLFKSCFCLQMSGAFSDMFRHMTLPASRIGALPNYSCSHEIYWKSAVVIYRLSRQIQAPPRQSERCLRGTAEPSRICRVTLVFKTILRPIALLRLASDGVQY